MDERERDIIRSQVRFAWLCDGTELTDQQVELDVEARLKARTELDQGGREAIKEEIANARARAVKEGRSFSDVLLEDEQARHKAHWEAVQNEEKSKSESAPHGRQSRLQEDT